MEVKDFYYKLLRYFFPTYKLTVSYNAIFGDADDTTYIVRKFYAKQEKYLKFKTEEGDTIEVRGAEGLNYRIEEI
jgi:hypothetical protein|tara:strand:+ start:209 stop:433 length:225 start_codon:yes stop_codon:yes gene_type:complete